MLPKFALHIKSVWNAVARHADAEFHLLALCGFDVILLDFNMIGQWFLEILLIVHDALRGFDGKRRQENHQQY